MGVIVDATKGIPIVASQDIYDDQGVKLWGKNQSVSYSLQQRLLDRKLRHPIESCLSAEDGVTTVDLLAAAQAWIESSESLVLGLQDLASQCLTQIRHLPIHSVVQLLLSSARTARAQDFEHAIHAMVLSGCIAVLRKADVSEVRLSLLGGLLHDLGEMYIDPQCLIRSAAMSTDSYRHLIVHPSLGELVLRSLTDYPASMIRGIGEHHERGDGQGYPLRCDWTKTSSLGRQLACVEAILEVAKSRPNLPWTRAGLALQLVPREFDSTTLAFVAHCRQHEKRDGRPHATSPDEASELFNTVAAIKGRIDAAIDGAAALESESGHAVVREVAANVAHQLRRIRLGGESSGLWWAQTPDVLDCHEVMLLCNELQFRIETVRLACTWHAKDLGPQAEKELQTLWLLTSANDGEMPDHARGQDRQAGSASMASGTL